MIHKSVSCPCPPCDTRAVAAFWLIRYRNRSLPYRTPRVVKVVLSDGSSPWLAWGSVA